MATKVTMPKLSDTMEEGTLVRWLKKEGETVDAAEVIAEAESDKATMELEAFDAGVLKKILVPEGGKVPVGGLLALIGEEDEDIGALLKEIEAEQAAAPAEPAEGKEQAAAEPVPEKEAAAAVKQPAAAAAAEPEKEPAEDTAAPGELLTTGGVRIKASPLARKMARERGLNLRRIAGTGSGGRIIRRDIEKAGPAGVRAAAAPAGAGGASEIPLSSMRESIASRMTLSKSTVPHFYLTVEVDMDRAVEARKSLNEAQSGIKISFNDLIIKAAALALRDHERVNGSFGEKGLMLHSDIDVGVAVALEDGLITPVLRRADTLSLGQIAQQVGELAGRARERKLAPEEYSNATFTISNLGMFGIEEFSAIINPPQSAILAVGGVAQKPVVREGELGIGYRMKMTLSCDHRIVDGAVGALFLADVQKKLENPMLMML